MAARKSTPSPDQLPLFATDDYVKEDRDKLRCKRTWETITGGKVICAECGAICPRRGPQQRYCVYCALQRAKKRQLDWGRKNRRPPEQHRKQYHRLHGRRKQIGVERERLDRWSLSDLMVDISEFAWIRKLSIPFHQSLSKNYKYRAREVNQPAWGYYQTKSQNELTGIVRETLDGTPMFRGKFYIDMLVQKPSHNGDAINFVDAVSDAIKKATIMDDRWFSFVRVDWQVIKDSPEILIGMGQKITEHHQVCSYCGIISSHGDFAKNRTMEHGISRQCKYCLEEYNKYMREKTSEKRKT